MVKITCHLKGCGNGNINFQDIIISLPDLTVELRTNYFYFLLYI